MADQEEGILAPNPPPAQCKHHKHHEIHKYQKLHRPHKFHKVHKDSN